MDRRHFLSYFRKLTGLGVGAVIGGNFVPTESFAATKKTLNLINAADLGLIANQTNDQSVILQNAVYDAAAKQMGLYIPAGRYNIANISLPNNSQIVGANGQTILFQANDAPIIDAYDANLINISNIHFEGNIVANIDSTLLKFEKCRSLKISDCSLYNGRGNGIILNQCNAQIIGNKLYKLGQTAIFATDGRHSKFMRNEIFEIDNNGIQVWQNTKAKDGSIVSHNHIYKIASLDGGNGQNGNGVNVFKANHVIVSDNRFDDCIYSAVRINGGDNCQIINNNCTNIGEVALYAEFSFNGVIINNNLVDLAGAGIAIANFNENGHLAVCKGNLVRNLTLRPKATENDDPRAFGIAAEADALIEGNIVENATNYGIGGGWGEYQRNLSIINNMVKDCGYGITASVVKGAGNITISNNSINNPKNGAIVGFEWEKPATDDLIDDDQIVGAGKHKNLNISNNVLI